MNPGSRPTRTARSLHLVNIALAMLVLSACATTSNVQQIDRLESIGENPRVLLMPVDIRYYLVTAGGVAEPHAEWTTAAQENFTAAMQDFAADMGADLVVLGDDDLTPDEMRYRSLHSAVGNAVLTHHFGTMKLPSKNGAFDWSLGPGMSDIADDKDADYALFVFYRDEQASGGRVFLSTLIVAAGGYASFGAEYGFASLVDLHTGNIVWFNVVRAGSGEMRDASGAARAVNALFKDIPMNTPVEGS